MGAPGLWVSYLCHSGSPASGGSPASEVLGFEILGFQVLVVALWLFEVIGFVALAVGGGEVFGEGCWVYWMVLCDIIDGDLDASISSTSSTDKSKTKKAASNPCKILVCRIVLTIFHFCSAVKYSASYCSLQIQTGFSRFKQASAAPSRLKYIIIQHSQNQDFSTAGDGLAMLFYG